jgi:hypothetical protein
MGSNPQSMDNKMPLIFPNPVHDILNIRLQPGSDFTEYEITDIHGKLLQSGTLNKETTQLKIARKEKGMYLLKLISSNRILVTKILN